MIEDFELQASFHTIELWIPGHIDFSGFENDVIKSQSWKHDKARNKYTKIIVNPNKMVANPKGILTFTEFSGIIESILNSVGVETYRINRADLRMDCYEVNHYEKYNKLYAYLITSFMADRSIKNSYASHDILTGQKKSTTIRNDTIQLEHYNRALKSQGQRDTTEPAKSRFELRSCRLRWADRYRMHGRYVDHPTNMQLLQKEFSEYWVKQLKDYSSSSALKAARAFVNESIIPDYNPTEKYTDFLNRHSERLYSTGQLQQLIGLIGISNPENKAKDYKRNHNLETYTNTDIKAAVKVMTVSIDEFFK